jgi:hypothetical protein
MVTLTDRAADIGLPVFSGDLVGLLAERRRNIAMAEAECLLLVAELLRRRAHEDLGYRSAVALLIDRLGVSAGAARGMVRLAAALEQMPCTLAALEVGSIDLGRARALVATRESAPQTFAEHEAALVDTVAGLPMVDVTRALAYWSQQAATEEATSEAAAVHERRRLFVSVVGGMVHLDGRLDPVSGEVVITALEAVCDRAHLDPTDTRTPAQRRADALVGLCSDHLDDAGTGVARSERPHVLVHVALDALEGRSGRPCELDQSGVITPAEARMLACDARITRVITGPGSQPLDVGRTTRVVPKGMRLALMVRDGGCAVEGCRAPRRWCDAHHIVHWADGGSTALPNLVLLCRFHHTRVHLGRARLPRRE